VSQNNRFRSGTSHHTESNWLVGARIADFGSLLLLSSSSFSFLNGAPSALEQERIQTDIENLLLTNLSKATQEKEAERAAKSGSEDRKGVDARPSAFDLSDLVGFFRGGMDVIVQDGFSRCFESSRSQPWNWNLYLWPLWAMGVLTRYFILFPIR
jgi:hypothetical protein